MAVTHSTERSITRAETPPPPTTRDVACLDKVRYVVGITLAVLGIVLAVATTIAFTGYFIGYAVGDIETLHTLFMTSIASILTGFHLARSESSSSARIRTGAITITI